MMSLTTEEECSMDSSPKAVPLSSTQYGVLKHFEPKIYKDLELY